ncbi:hypothetical protein EV702DRAFT_1194668 [Suillus placidus]|uniref:Uncharacterized protein n=1 Tax=Suillus placidus TaxID=48579 RepID=A0A9P7D5J5_9AGAM|nr:hypothetical protein EV702DRAFT_1194668 [Suillus placidus]
MFSSAPGMDRAGDMMALTLKCKGKGKDKDLPPSDHIDSVDELMEADLYDDSLGPNPPAAHPSPTVNAFPAVNAPTAVNAPPAAVNVSPTIHSSPTVHTPPAIRTPPAVCAPPTVNTPPTINASPANSNPDYVMDDTYWETFEPQDEQPQGEQHARASTKHPFPAPLPPPTPPPTSHGTFKSHADWAINRGSICSPQSPPSVPSSSVGSHISSSHQSVTLSARRASGSHKPGQSSSLSNQVQSDVNDVRGQVKSLAEGMNYIYTAKAAQSEYKIAKVNSHRQQLEIEFQCKQAELECSEAAVVH